MKFNWKHSIGMLLISTVLFGMGYEYGSYQTKKKDEEWLKTEIIKAYCVGFEGGYQNGLIDGSIPGADLIFIDPLTGKKTYEVKNP